MVDFWLQAFFIKPQAYATTNLERAGVIGGGVGISAAIDG